MKATFLFLLLEHINHLHMVICSRKSLRDHLSTSPMNYFHEKRLFNMQEMSDHLYDGNLIIAFVRVNGSMCFPFMSHEFKHLSLELKGSWGSCVHLRNWFSSLYYV